MGIRVFVYLVVAVHASHPEGSLHLLQLQATQPNICPRVPTICPEEGSQKTDDCPEGCTHIESCSQCREAAAFWKRKFDSRPFKGRRPTGCFRNRKWKIKCNDKGPFGGFRGKWPVCAIVPGHERWKGTKYEAKPCITTTTTTTITTTQPELTAGRGCIKARDNGYAELTIGGGRQCVSSISMIRTNSEKLHCGISPAQKHTWGCGQKWDVGIVMTDANDNLLVPKKRAQNNFGFLKGYQLSPICGGNPNNNAYSWNGYGLWYSLGAPFSLQNSQVLTWEFVKPQFISGGIYRFWYNEDLVPSGESESDNGGQACIRLNFTYAEGCTESLR